MQAYGASVVAYEKGPDRWSVMSAAVDEFGWTAMSGPMSPPIGSNPFGIEGSRSGEIAIETLKLAVAHIFRWWFARTLFARSGMHEGARSRYRPLKSARLVGQRGSQFVAEAQLDAVSPIATMSVPHRVKGTGVALPNLPHH